MSLHPIKHDLKTTLWCGPAALSAVTGRPTSEIVRVIKDIRKSTRPVKGVRTSTLGLAAQRLGYKLESIWNLYFEGPEGGMQRRKQPTLAAFTRDFSAYFQTFPVIVNLTHHYVTIHKNTFVDNHVEQPVRLKKAPHRRCRVEGAWRVIPIENAAVNIPPAPVKPKDTARPAREEAKRLAAQYGIQLDSATPCSLPGENWVFPPPSLDSEELDPHYGDHIAYDWHETLAKVRDYVKALGELRSKQTVLTSEQTETTVPV